MEYKGNVEIRKIDEAEWLEKLKDVDKITGYLSIHNNVKFSQLQTVGGDLYIHSNVKASVPQLQTVGGNLYIRIELPHKLEKRLFSKNRGNKWILTNESSNWLLNRKFKNVEYRINDVLFETDLFDKVRKNKLSASEIFKIGNIEQRRVAYEFMDKIKMKALPNFKILDESIDGYNNPMQIISFELAGFKDPFLYLSCVCPSTGREYFLETKEVECTSAKMGSFGLPADAKFTKEW